MLFGTRLFGFPGGNRAVELTMVGPGSQSGKPRRREPLLGAHTALPPSQLSSLSRGMSSVSKAHCVKTLEKKTLGSDIRGTSAL